MKTKPTSLRFEEDDLRLAKKKSGITKVQKLMDFLVSEYVREFKPSFTSSTPIHEPINVEKATAKRVDKKREPEPKSTGSKVKWGISKEEFERPEIRKANEPLLPIDRDAILKQIETIRAEIIPKERDTALGRKVWSIDQANRIKELENKING